MSSLFKCSTHRLHLYCIYKPEAKWRLLGCQSALQACQFLTLAPPLRKVSGFLKALLRRNWDRSSGSTDTILKWTSAYFWNMILKIYISKLSFMVPYSEYWFDTTPCQYRSVKHTDHQLYKLSGPCNAKDTMSAICEPLYGIWNHSDATLKPVLGPSFLIGNANSSLPTISLKTRSCPCTCYI